MTFTVSQLGIRLPALATSAVVTRLASWRLVMMGCLPRRPRHWLASRHPDRVVVPNGDKADVFREVFGERQLISAVDLQNTDAPLSLGADDKQAWRSTILELPAEVVLIRRLVLPAQVRENLNQVLTYELDRFTPFDPANVFFDDRVAAGHDRKIEVELAVCPRVGATKWLDYLRSIGTPVSKLTWHGAWAEANLLPPAARPKPRRQPLVLAWALFLLIMVLIAAVLATPLWQRAADQGRLKQELKKVAVQAEEVSSVREALDRARLGSVAVLERKRSLPRMTELMLELTQLLPDGTWVQTLNYRDGTVDIRGESTQATALIGILERGVGINNVTFRSPVMQVAASGKERFHIAFNYQMAAPQ